jgi:hypothetical protein
MINECSVIFFIKKIFRVTDNCEIQDMACYWGLSEIRRIFALKGAYHFSQRTLQRNIFRTAYELMIMERS